MPFHRRKALALVAYLATKRRAQSRELLCALLWPKLDSARANLRRELSLLKAEIGAKLLDVSRIDVALNLDAIEIDLTQFRELKTRANVALDNLDTAQPEKIALLEQACSLYTDDFLAGFNIEDSIEFGNWQFYEAESLRRSFSSILQTLLEWHRRHQQYSSALDYARRLLHMDVFNETSHRYLMTVLAESGEHHNALMHYDYCVELLRNELGVLPDTETSDLAERIRNRQFSPPPAAAVTTSQESIKHNLTRETLFIGRKREQMELADLLLNSDIRLITLLAAGGMGKTSLAKKIAYNILSTKKTPFTDGVYIVELTGANTLDKFLAALTELTAQSYTSHKRALKQYVMEYFVNKSMLLILDNFEELVDEAPLVSEILSVAPKSKIMVTSRQPLRLQEETLYYVKSLSLPNSIEDTAFLDYDIVQLFLAVAKRVNPQFKLKKSQYLSLLRIAEYVDGMPLGIILAASWLDVMSVNEISYETSNSLDILSNELLNVPERHRSIRAVFEPTWQRLPETSRVMFMKLAVFQDSFTSEAATRVTNASMRDLATLVRQSLLHRDLITGRYHIHELLRQFAREKLAETDFYESSYHAHTTYYLKTLTQYGNSIKYAHQREGVKNSEADFDNIRVAWLRAVQERNYLLLNESLNSLRHVRNLSRKVFEVSQLFEETMQLLQADRHVPRVDRFWHKVVIHSALNAFGIDLNVLETNLSYAIEEKDWHEVALTYEIMSEHFRMNMYDLEKALAYMNISLEVYLEHGHLFEASWVYLLAARLYSALCETESCARYLNISIEICQEIGNLAGLATCYYDRAINNQQIGNFAEAENLLQESHNLYLGAELWETSTSLNLSLNALLTGSFTHAHTRLEATPEIDPGRLQNMERRMINSGQEKAYDEEHINLLYPKVIMAYLAIVRREYQDAFDILNVTSNYKLSGVYKKLLIPARALTEISSGRNVETREELFSLAHSFDKTNEIVYVLLYFAVCAVVLAKEDPRSASTLFGFVLTNRVEVPLIRELPPVNDTLHKLRTEMGDAEFTRAYIEGSERDVDTLLAELKKQYD